MHYKRKHCQRQGATRRPSYNQNCRCFGNKDSRYYTGSKAPRQSKSKKNRIEPDQLE